MKITVTVHLTSIEAIRVRQYSIERVMNTAESIMSAVEMDDVDDRTIQQAQENEGDIAACKSIMRMIWNAVRDEVILKHT
ncbi:MAG: hypothetical protein QQN63_06450 [Nitrosopumilus sp.]